MKKYGSLYGTLGHAAQQGEKFGKVLNYRQEVLYVFPCYSLRFISSLLTRIVASFGIVGLQHWKFPIPLPQSLFQPCIR
jgi:hypothetical protein